MNKFDNNIHLSANRSSLYSVFLILFLSLFGFFIVGPVIGMVVALPFFDGNVMDFYTAMANPSSGSIKVPMFIVQGFATLTGMIIVPMLYLNVAEKKGLPIFFKKPVSWLSIVLALIIVITFMGVNSIFIEWNAGVDFPDFLSGFEEWARQTEDLAAQMTEYLTTFDNTGQFILAFVVIAILPAIGEELVFRGLLQNEFHSLTKNIHIAIWVSAILFSSIHMQFYGFVPRMLLGALFGYLYYWSGNLTIPIVAHLVNNGLTLTLLYMHRLGIIETDITDTETAPLYTVGIFAIITAVLLYNFRNHFLKASSDR